MDSDDEEYGTQDGLRESMRSLLLMVPKFQEDHALLDKALDDFLSSQRKKQQKRNRKRYVYQKKQEEGLAEKAEQVNTRLVELGVTNIDKVSYCLRRAILLGHISLDGPNPLDQEITSDQCEICYVGEVVATVRTLLYQPDYGGTDYEDGSGKACAKCNKCGVKSYITCLCVGKSYLDGGKFHNHCRICPNFGTCIGDYRERHCRLCGEHYFGRGRCYVCKGNGADYGCKESEIDMNEEFSESENEEEEEKQEETKEEPKQEKESKKEEDKDITTPTKKQRLQ